MTEGTAERDDDAALAGEYVLGLLAEDEKRRFERRLIAEPELRRLVAEWTESLVTLTDPIPSQPPPASVKTALDARLFPKGSRRASLPRLLAGILAGLATALVILAAIPYLAPSSGQPVYLAEIASQDHSLVVLARLDTATGTLTLERTSGGPQPGRSLQLWLIPRGAAAPMPLDVIDAAASSHNVPAELIPAFTDGGTLAISDEPLGGSPTGQPTTVLATAPVVLI